MPDADRDLARVRTLARVMDGYFSDPLIGFVWPGVGDVFDLGFKANQKNVALLEQRRTGRATGHDWLFVAGAVAAYLAVMALVVWGVVALVRAL